MYNRRHRRYLSGVLALALAVGLITPNGAVSMATGTDSTEASTTETTTTEKSAADKTEAVATESNGTADASIDKAKTDAAEYSKKRKKAQQILDNLKEAKDNIENYVIQLDKSLNELQIEISHLEENQKELEATIKDTKANLKEAEAAQEQQYNEMKQRIQMVYESGDKRYLDVLLTASSMTDMMNKTEYVSQVSLYDYNILKELKAAKEQVANIKMKLEKDLKSNEALQKEVSEQKETVEVLVDEKKSQIEQYDVSIADQQAEVQKYTQAQQEAENIIAAAEAEAASNNAGGGSANTVYTGGVFTWPVPGYNQITSYFGSRTSPVAGASSNHRGIDIACDTGAAVVAAASGTVIVAAYNYAEGNYVCIDHGGGVVTVYMHNSSLAVSVGETVSAGQTIAYAGSTGVSTGPHCHFGVRVNGGYVDPLGYLQ